jgi:Uma2 family endonuclease
MATFTLDLSPIITLTREEFRKLCAANPEMKLERSAKGELLIMSPTGGETGNWNSELTSEVVFWNRQSQTGKTFDSSTGFELPQGSDRSPDVAWIPLEKWQALTPEQQRGCLPLCPDFVIELLSPSDSWKQGQAKMEEYRANGCRLGWLLDPKGQRVAIYRPHQPVEILTAPATLSGEDVLPGFVLNLQFLWQSLP